MEDNGVIFDIKNINVAALEARTVYCGGPMTGYPNDNYDAFNAAAAQLRAEGFKVYNPAEHERLTGLTWFDFMKKDIPLVCKSDMLMLLPGWQDSKAARLEVLIATQLRIKIFEYETRKQIFPSFTFRMDLYESVQRSES